MDPNTGKMYVSQDVVFDENQAWTWENSGKIKETPGITFTVEGFNFDDGFDDEIGDWVPDTPDQGHMASDLNEDWVNFDQSNDLTDSGSSQPGTPINSPNTPNSNTMQDSPIHTPTSNTTSSSTGGGAPKRYRLLTDLYEATYEIHIPLEELQLIRNVKNHPHMSKRLKKRNGHKQWKRS